MLKKACSETRFRRYGRVKGGERHDIDSVERETMV